MDSAQIGKINADTVGLMPDALEDSAVTRRKEHSGSADYARYYTIAVFEGMMKPLDQYGYVVDRYVRKNFGYKKIGPSYEHAEFIRVMESLAGVVLNLKLWTSSRCATMRVPRSELSGATTCCTKCLLNRVGFRKNRKALNHNFAFNFRLGSPSLSTTLKS